VTISKLTAQTKDSIKIAPYQIKNIYIGLKQGEQYKIKYLNCLDVSAKLDSIIQDQHKKTLLFASKISERDSLYSAINFQYAMKVAENERIKNKKIPWYLHPITYLLAGFTGGIVLFGK